jgi:hypothetical protein
LEFISAPERAPARVSHALWQQQLRRLCVCAMLCECVYKVAAARAFNNAVVRIKSEFPGITSSKNKFCHLEFPPNPNAKMFCEITRHTSFCQKNKLAENKLFNKNYYQETAALLINNSCLFVKCKTN